MGISAVDETSSRGTKGLLRKNIVLLTLRFRAKNIVLLTLRFRAKNIVLP
ncbi:hypothetical protein [Bacillus sp. RS11]